MFDGKIAVLGVGANGGSIGADLTQAGLDVTLIDQWPENVDALRRYGLTVEMPNETTKTEVRAMHICDIATLRHQYDVVFLVLKAYDSRWACELIKPYLKSDGLVIGLQNGMMIDTIADVVGVERTLGAVIEIAAAIWKPGIVERHTPPSGTWFGLGSLCEQTMGREESISEILRFGGTVEVVDDIRSAKWMKLVVNAAELVTSAICNLPLLEAAQIPGMDTFMRINGKEAVRTAISVGHNVVPIIGLSEVDPGDPEGFVDTMLDAVYTNWALPHTRTTVLQDWDKGRRGEVDQLNGYVVEQQLQHGGSAPANQRTVEIAHEIERGVRKPAPENADLLLAPL